MADNQDTVSTPSSAMSGGVGTLLRETREKLGRDLDTVAISLRIRQAYLQAIEDGRFEDLPGSTYAVGFVRGYAEYLGLDSLEIVRRFKQENSDYASRSELVFPAASSEGSLPTSALLGFAVVAAAVAYGAWHWYQGRDVSVAEAVPQLPERLAALIHRPVGNGAEVVPVPPTDGAKPGDAPANASAPQTAQPSPAGAAPGREEIVPPTEGDAGGSEAQATAGTSPQAALPATASAGPGSAPVGETAAPAAVAANTAGTPAIAENFVPPSGEDAKPADQAAPEAKPAEPTAGNKAIAVAPGKPPKGKDAKAEVSKPAADQTKPTVPAAAAAAGTAPDGAAKSADQQPADAAAVPQAPSRIVLRADENCWIEIRDANGQVIHSRLLHKGERYSVPGRSGLTLTAGNSGALAVLVDGKPVSRLGRVGVVRHGVPLDPERLQTIGQPDEPASAPTPAAGVPAAGVTPADATPALPTDGRAQ